MSARDRLTGGRARAAVGLAASFALLIGGVACGRAPAPKVSLAKFNDDTPSPSPTDSLEPIPSDSPSDVVIDRVFPLVVPLIAPSDSPSPLVCNNSFDPACGDFYWTSDPGPDAPLVVSIDASTTNASVGDTVTITMHAVDPDAPIECVWAFFGEGDIMALMPPTIPPRYGPWSTPPKEPGDETQTFTHQYANPGTYNVSAIAESGSCSVPKYGPYDDTASSDPVAVTIVGPSPTGTPSPSDSPTPIDSPTPTDSPTPSPSDSISASPSSSP